MKKIVALLGGACGVRVHCLVKNVSEATAETVSGIKQAKLQRFVDFAEAC